MSPPGTGEKRGMVLAYDYSHSGANPERPVNVAKPELYDPVLARTILVNRLEALRGKSPEHQAC